MFNLKVFEEDPEEETSISKPVRSPHQQNGGRRGKARSENRAAISVKNNILAPNKTRSALNP